jgi:hypothetical protein
MLQRPQQADHPRRGDRQRPAALPAGLHAKIKHALPGCQALPRRRLQQLRLHLIVSRAQMLDIPRPTAGGVHHAHASQALSM